jgi:peroxiredoxin
MLILHTPQNSVFYHQIHLQQNVIMLAVGQKAPDFKLFDTNKQEVSLSSFAGKQVVILFFPLAFTSVCTAELCNIRDNYAVYNQLNAEVIGVSVDSLFTLGKFKEEQKLTFTLLSDFNAVTAESYGALYDEFVLGMKRVSKRAAFVVGTDGNLKYVEVLASAGDLPNFEAIQKALQA